MSQLIMIALAGLLAWGAIVALRNRHAEAAQSSRATDDDDEIDREALEQAEREVRDVESDGKGRPTDDVVGDDWGPGTPKPPYV